MILSFVGLAKRYGDTVALRGVTFDVRAGEIFGLLGPNGAGKSTLIRVLMDIIRADSGEVRVFGEPRRRDHLDRLGYLPEERGLYTKLKVIEVLTYFGTLKGLARPDARRRGLEWLERVELPHVSGWRVDRLSKGMSQKVQIAGALLSDPELCVLDEPTTGLDPVNVRLVQDLLLERRTRGRTTILSTHHMNQVEALCDRVALINKGELVVYGAVDEVRRRYSLPEVRVQAIGPLPAIPLVVDAMEESAGTWRVTLGAGTAPADMLAALVAAGARIERFEPILAHMEDIFLRVVQEGPGMIRWHKVRTVAHFEFITAVTRVGFLVITFGMPLFVAAYGAIVAVPAYYSAKRDREPAVYGVVDRPGLLNLSADVSPGQADPQNDARRMLEATGQAAAVDRVVPRSRFVFRPVTDEPKARELLAGRSIRGYFVLPDDYLAKGVVDVYTPDTFNVTGSDARGAFGTVVRERLVRGRMAPELAARVITPIPSTRGYAVTRGGDIKDGGQAASVARVALPLAFTVLFVMSVLMTSGFLLQGTATEKENKVVEVLLASANPDEIMAGKLLGLGAAGLIQVGVWMAMLFLTGFGAIPLLFDSQVELPWRALLIALPFFIIAFLFFGSMMLGSGSLGSNMREAQQLSMAWSLTAALPLMLIGVLIREPHGLMARGMTWLPFTAGPVVIMRASIDPEFLPWWEIAGPLLLLMAATWAAIRIGARLFRVGLLSAGARPSMREVLRQARLGG